MRECHFAPSRNRPLYDQFVYQIELVEDLLAILPKDTIPPDLNYFEIWKHPRFYFSQIAETETAPLNTLEIQEFVSQYLDQEYRSKTLDKLLVQMLVRAEAHAFIDEMYHAPGIKGLSPPALKKRPHPIFSNFKFIVISGISLGLPGWFLAASFGGFLNTVGWILIILFILLWAVLVFSIPSQLSAWKKAHSMVDTVIAEMQTCYTGLGSSGPISVGKTQRQLEKSSDKGVIWPSELFVLLEDIEKRRQVL